MAMKTPPSIIKTLPNDLRQITLDQFEAWTKWLAETHPLDGKVSLRQRQRVAESQIASAVEQINREGETARLERGIANANILLAVASAAVDFQTFGGNGWEAHIPNELKQPSAT